VVVYRRNSVRVLLFTLCLILQAQRGDFAHAQAAGGEAPLIEIADWRSYVRVSHYDPAGIPCYERVEEPRQVVRRFYYKHPLYLVAREGSLARVRDKDLECYVEGDRLAEVHSQPVFCLKSSAPCPLEPLENLVDGEVSPKGGTPVGRLFPTFYHIAMESLYPPGPGEKRVSLRDGEGHRIARVSPGFRRALLIQGTAALADGRVLNVGKKTKKGRRFVVLPAGSYGLGISGFHLHPFRSAAVDFDYLCRQLKSARGCHASNYPQRDKSVSRRNRKALVGMLLYLPRLAGVEIAPGMIHDGFVCAVDVGGGIKNDRIDLYVGTGNGGNPYYPDCRRLNPLLRAGIETLIPSDWHHFVSGDKGRMEREIPTEYRQVSPHKGLEVFAYPDVQCRRRVRK